LGNIGNKVLRFRICSVPPPPDLVKNWLLLTCDLRAFESFKMSSINAQNLLLPPRHSPVVGVAHDKVPAAIRSTSFDEIPSWASLKCNSSTIKSHRIQQGQVENLHLISLSKQGKLKEVEEFLKRMDEAGVSVSPHSYKSLLETCGRLRAISDGRLIHDRLRITVKDPTGFLEDCVLQMYCDCGSFVDAQKLFDGMLERNYLCLREGGAFGQSCSVVLAYAEVSIRNYTDPVYLY